MYQNKLLAALAEIQNACIGEITMGYRLDAMHIGELISSATGMTNPELNKYIDEISQEQS